MVFDCHARVAQAAAGRYQREDRCAIRTGAAGRLRPLSASRVWPLRSSRRRAPLPAGCRTRSRRG
ncbi:MAG: hypothetical protein MZU91_08505 [Desulfosudis oleivorans]|nr:hypothetical protein [Desulfosudis oleivorans]